MPQRSPSRSRAWATSWLTLVLPLVPVTPIRSARGSARRRNARRPPTVVRPAPSPRSAAHRWAAALRRLPPRKPRQPRRGRGIGDVRATILAPARHRQEQVARTNAAAIQGQLADQQIALGLGKQLVQAQASATPSFAGAALTCCCSVAVGRLSGGTFIRRSAPAMTAEHRRRHQAAEVARLARLVDHHDHRDARIGGRGETGEQRAIGVFR